MIKVVLILAAMAADGKPMQQQIEQPDMNTCWAIAQEFMKQDPIDVTLGGKFEKGMVQISATCLKFDTSTPS